MTHSLRGAARRRTVLVAAWSVLLVYAGPAATAAPATDDQGFVDSTARCTSPDTAAAFGSTATSRVAICKSPGGEYEYRGVRLRDGAKLIIPASKSGDGFAATNDGITYTVTASALAVTAGSQVIRDESMLSYHGPGTAGASSAPASPATPAPSTTPATPLPPPLPAEAGAN